MGRIIGWVLCLALIGLLEIPALRKSKSKYDLWVFCGLLAVTLAYGVLYFLDVQMPDPNGIVKWLFGPLGKRLMHTST